LGGREVRGERAAHAHKIRNLNGDKQGLGHVVAAKVLHVLHCFSFIDTLMKKINDGSFILVLKLSAVHLACQYY
jgi:hypothetical protein